MLTPERPFLLGVNFLSRRKAIMNCKTKRITAIGMLCAITYVTMVVGRIPIILFLKYDPSDVIVTLGGFIWGPMTSCIVSVIVATYEYRTNTIFCVYGVYHLQKKAHSIWCTDWPGIGVANNGYCYAAVELFGNTTLYGVSKRSGCGIVTPCLSSI